MKIAKWHGIGNDYLLVHERDLPEGGLTPRAVTAICDRHFGIGGDGILVLGASDVADARMVIHNPDGSQAEMCGNGIRMAARFLQAEGVITAAEMSIETAGGIMRPTVLADGTVRVDMGYAVTEAVDTIQLDSGQLLRGRPVSMGNPHFVIAEEPESVDLPVVGRAAEHHARFPERANIEFIRMNADDDVTMRVWERGVGETLACGTGACAVGVSAVLDHGGTSPLTVHLRGGDLTIEVADDLHVFMTGSATHIFSTDIDPATIEQPAAIARRHERARA